jgi:hypothetical protein
MKWVLFLGAGVIAMAAIVAAIGAALPRNHKASRTLRVKRAPAEVWPAITAATSASDVPVDVLEQTPPHRLVTRVKATEQMFGGTWTIVVAAEPAGSAVTITEDGWVANPIFRFVSRFVIGHHATMDGMLRTVAKTLNEEPALSGE